MELNTTIDGTSATIAVKGSLTVATSPDLEAAFENLPEGVEDVALDVSELEYVASAGLRVIMAGDKSLRRSGGALRLVHPNEVVKEVLEITGLVVILKIED